jgi:hypothetical protein
MRPCKTLQIVRVVGDALYRNSLEKEKFKERNLTAGAALS